MRVQRVHAAKVWSVVWGGDGSAVFLVVVCFVVLVHVHVVRGGLVKLFFFVCSSANVIHFVNGLYVIETCKYVYVSVWLWLCT